MKNRNRLYYTFFASLILTGAPSWGAQIGIIDSGTDLKHPDLEAKAWTNPGNLKGDTFKDDVHGWNFAENNNEIIDYSYLGKFSPDTTTYFNTQLKLLNGTATPEDKKWMEDKKKDQEFIKELMKFGNFVHGTHVAGISARTAEHAKIMAAKIIPTEVKSELPELPSQNLLSSFNLFPLDGNPLIDLAMSFILGYVVDQQSKTLAPIGAYLDATEMQVANCSFGTSMVQAKQVVKAISKTLLLGHELSDAEADKYGKYFIQQVIEKGKTFVSSAQKTLFVIAAGNDGTNNDESPIFPANLKFDNTITVAATRGYDRLASFSNFGSKMVEIAAPGVGIISDIPGGVTMPLSGTSQAAPFITNLAGRILDANPKLSLPEVKEILMGTVDKKDFLVGKVTSEGIANPERAVSAAGLSTQTSVKEAIQQARVAIADVKTPGFRALGNSRYDGDPVRLPSSFSW